MPDWSGWVWPVPIWEGREPIITQHWKPGHDPAPGESSGADSNHLGVDILFRKLPTDPQGFVVHDTEGPFIAPPGTPIIAAGDGQIWETGESCYGKYVRLDHPGQGVNTFYQHLDSFERSWKKGDVVRAGQILGRMGYSSCAGPDGVRHLHFEIWWFTDGMSGSRLDPEPYMNTWPKIEVSQLEAFGSRLSNPPVVAAIGFAAGMLISAFKLIPWSFGRRSR